MGIVRCCPISPNVALSGHAPMSKLSPLSRVKRKLDFELANGGLWRAKRSFVIIQAPLEAW
jgi:hypothetical protein